MAVIAVDAGVRAEIWVMAVPSLTRLCRRAPPGQRGEAVGPVGLGRPDGVEAQLLGGGDLVDGVGRGPARRPVADDQAQLHPALPTRAVGVGRAVAVAGVGWSASRRRPPARLRRCRSAASLDSRLLLARQGAEPGQAGQHLAQLVELVGHGVALAGEVGDLALGGLLGDLGVGLGVEDQLVGLGLGVGHRAVGEATWPWR